MRIVPRMRGQTRTAVTTAVLGAAWTAAVCWRPGLPGGGAAGLDRQSSLLIAVASILAALVVLMLTLGSIALQILSEFSWQLTRTVVDRLLAASLAFSAIGGVILPLWMVTDPDTTRTRVALTTAGWSALILMSSAWTVASRINPVALADRTSLVEKTLEEIGSLLRHETVRQTDYPEDRTGWRNPWRQRDTPVTAVLAAQVKLMDLAFEACFDRRALLTGRRILASATLSAEVNDRSRLQAAIKAIESVVFGTMARDRYTDAGQHRNSAILTGLMAEADSLYACAENPACRESIEDVAYKFMWLTDAGYEVPIACWEAELRGLSWPDRPAARSAERADGGPAVVHRLSARLVAQAQKIVTDAPDPSWTAAAVTSLWANAAGNLPEDNGHEARRLAAFLTGPAHENRAWRNGALPTSWPATAAIRQLARLIAAVVAWSENGDLSAPLDIPAPSQPESLTDIARRLADDPRRLDVVYRGLFIDDTSVVVVVENDGSQRLLRDAEACARNRFTWGYQGTGPHRLAKTLLTDVLGSHLRCPACLGSAQAGAGVVRCATCHNRGLHDDMEQAETALVRTLLSKLPQRCCWKLTAKTILTHLASR